MEINYNNTDKCYTCKVDLPNNPLNREIVKRMFAIYSSRNGNIVALKSFKTSKDMCLFIEDWFTLKSLLSL